MANKKTKREQSEVIRKNGRVDLYDTEAPGRFGAEERDAMETSTDAPKSNFVKRSQRGISSDDMLPFDSDNASERDPLDDLGIRGGQIPASEPLDMASLGKKKSKSSRRRAKKKQKSSTTLADLRRPAQAKTDLRSGLVGLQDGARSITESEMYPPPQDNQSHLVAGGQDYETKLRLPQVSMGGDDSKDIASRGQLDQRFAQGLNNFTEGMGNTTAVMELGPLAAKYAGKAALKFAPKMSAGLSESYGPKAVAQVGEGLERTVMRPQPMFRRKPMDVPAHDPSITTLDSPNVNLPPQSDQRYWGTGADTIVDREIPGALQAEQRSASTADLGPAPLDTMVDPQVRTLPPRQQTPPSLSGQLRETMARLDDGQSLGQINAARKANPVRIGGEQPQTLVDPFNGQTVPEFNAGNTVHELAPNTIPDQQMFPPPELDGTEFGFGPQVSREQLVNQSPDELYNALGVQFGEGTNPMRPMLQSGGGLQAPSLPSNVYELGAMQPRPVQRGMQLPRLQMGEEFAGAAQPAPFESNPPMLEDAFGAEDLHADRYNFLDDDKRRKYLLGGLAAGAAAGAGGWLLKRSMADRGTGEAAPKTSPKASRKPQR